MEQRDSTESPEIDPHKYSQVISDKGAKAIQWSKDSLFNKWCWNNWTSDTCKKMNVDIDIVPLTKINSKWIPDLNVKYRTMKFLKDNIGENLDELGFGNDLSDTVPKV